MPHLVGVRLDGQRHVDGQHLEEEGQLIAEAIPDLRP